MKWRKRPVVIDAIRYSGENGMEIAHWSNYAVVQSPVLEPSPENKTGSYLQIKTLEGVMIGNVGDWIIKGVHGEFYPCKPDIFEKTYEAADESPIKEDGEDDRLEKCCKLLEEYFKFSSASEAKASHELITFYRKRKTPNQ